jgi:hypothetical protein
MAATGGSTATGVGSLLTTGVVGSDWGSTKVVGSVKASGSVGLTRSLGSRSGLGSMAKFGTDSLYSKSLSFFALSCVLRQSSYASRNCLRIKGFALTVAFTASPHLLVA